MRNVAFSGSMSPASRGERRDADDVTLVAAALDGDRRAFKELVDRYIDDLARTVAGMLGPVPEVDDIVQESFIRLYNALPTFRGDSSVKTYVTRIAINRSLDALRKRKRRQWMQPFSVLDYHPEPEQSGSPSDDVEFSDRDRFLRIAVDTLPPKQRAVVVLRMIEEYSTEETSEILDIPYGTVLSRLKRALDRLRETLSDAGYDSVTDV